MSSADDLVGYDRKSRPYMKVGPVGWWLAGAGIGAVAILMVEMNVAPPPGDPNRQRLGLVMLMLAVGYLTLGAWLFVRRFRQYTAELRRRGQHHGTPTRSREAWE